MDSPPLVSIVLPVYNGESYVAAALDRLIAQPYSNVEIIVVDDKSSDSTLDIVRPYARSRRLTVLPLATNGGVAAARNAALGSARGTYVWFVDVDDEWALDFLPLMVRAAEAAGADVAVCSATYRFGPGLSRVEPVVRYESDAVLTGMGAVENILLGSGALWNKLIRRDALGEDPFPPLRSKSDHGGVLTILPRLKTVAVVSDTLYTYVQRDGSISNGGVSQPQNFIALLPLAERSLERMPPSPELSRLESRFRCMVVARAIRESWKLDVTDGGPREEMAERVSWADLARLRPTDRRTLLTCVGAKLAPRISRRVFRRMGRRRWSTQGAAA